MMDYHAIHGHDTASFDIPSSTHRLPTVPASQALEDLKADPAAHISTGLTALDCALLGLEDSQDSQNATVHGGVKRGQVTEIWGPPGCGKTALGIQLAANALSDGHGPTQASKRLQGLQFIITTLQKLAATKNCAVVLLSQCATKMRSEQMATLIPSINTTVWEQGLSTRLVLFRDWAWNASKSSSVFLAGLQKIDGRAAQDAVEHVSAFKVESAGISSVHYEASNSDMEVAAIAPRPKRKLGQTDLEVPDSDDDDEDYGWADEDEDALPPPPSQWQGSEDLILGENAGLTEDESEAEEGLQDYYYEDDDAGDGDRSNNEND
ncbi:DNA repair protein rhp55 [Trichoderma asperellum]|uniref:DNA repair protein rhp55 n=1 Tax=Trichoderma asperellum TaxID=101201 RepID=A0A6V8QLF3_TRIAP|nr:DNA repair protein rhp55 [Trichoderma asperellum]